MSGWSSEKWILETNFLQEIDFCLQKICFYALVTGADSNISRIPIMNVQI